MTKLKIITVHEPLYQSTLELRNEVLRLPIGMDIKNDDLGDEINQFHFVAIKEGQLVGVVIMKVEEEIGKLRQMAVKPSLQGQQIGRKLVNFLEDYAKSQGLKVIKLHARHYAIGFYEKLGYSKTSKSAFEEVGMEHFEMEKIIE